MRIAAVTLFLLAACAATVAQAQNTVTCESKNKARTECEMNTQGEVVVSRQLSKAACTEGVTWGLSKHAVWVEGGCRAEFENRSAAAPPPAAASQGGIPLLNASCPTGLDVHADQGGPVYVNGKEATLKKSNDNYYEAKDAASGAVISLSRNPDGTMSVSYTGRGGANGVCTLK
jgi:hypothetical protein